VEPGAAGFQREVEVIVHRIEVGGQQEFRSARRRVEAIIGGPECPAADFRQVGGENRFVKLDPFAQFGEFADDFSVGFDQRVEFLPAVEPVDPLGQREKGERTDQHRFRVEPEGGGLARPVDQRTPGEFRGEVFRDFRNDVVIVGVEPLGHLHGGNSGRAARHGEIGLRRYRRQGAEPLRRRAERDDDIEHVVVAGEIADGDEVESASFLDFPVGFADGCATRVEPGGAEFAFPEGFESKFQLPSGPDSREAEDVFLHSAAPFSYE